MTLEEFSNTFDTLLNSYNSQAVFGQGASKNEIVLDEYEKSVLLTQAQDQIVKSYFDRTLNQMGQGFDDSTRRQVDFSSLIKVATLSPVFGETYDDRGILYKLPPRNINPYDEIYIRTMALGNMLIYQLDSTPQEGDIWSFTSDDKKTYYQGTVKVNTGSNASEYPLIVKISDSTIGIKSDGTKEKIAGAGEGFFTHGKFVIKRRVSSGNATTADGDFDSTDVLFILNEKLSAKAKTISNSGKEQTVDRTYVIVPINYKEYDREMSKPYSQPLKKQAWRLFQNSSTGFDVQSELIPRDGIKATSGNQFQYKIRYVRRPNPIVLQDLPGNLDIDGYTSATPCELNPILHMDILQRAIDIARQTRLSSAAAYEQSERQAAQQSRRNND